MICSRTSISRQSTVPLATGITDWSAYIDKVEVLIGGQVGEQDGGTRHIARIMATTIPERIFRYRSANTFCLALLVCENFKAFRSWVGVQRRRVDHAGAAANLKWECFRISFTSTRPAAGSKTGRLSHHTDAKNLASGGKIQELSLNHPVKLLRRRTRLGRFALPFNKIKCR